MTDGWQVDEVTVRFGTLTALDAVSLQVGPGELVAVSGPSGAGKSTLLLTMAGLHPTASGTLTFGGKAVTGRLDDVVIVPQGNALAAALTAFENVMVPLLGRSLSAATARARTVAALQTVGLAQSHGHLAEELSGGQQQRVAVARALAAEPQWLIADEPTSELDAGNRQVVLGELRRLADEGAGVVMATHDVEASGVADRHLRLVDGRLT